MSTGSANPNVSNQTSSVVRPIFAGDYAAADEGSFFTSYQGLVASTAVATTTQVLAQANPTVAIQNSAPAGSGINLYLRYIKLYMSAVTTGATSAQAVGTLDPMANKLTTITSPIVGPNNVNSSSATASRALVYGGVLVAAATSSAGKIVHTNVVTNSIPIILDSWVLSYGEPVSGNNMIGTMTLVKEITVACPPVIIAPQWWYTLGFWGASWAAAAPTYSIEVGWIERPSGQ